MPLKDKICEKIITFERESDAYVSMKSYIGNGNVNSIAQVMHQTYKECMYLVCTTK